MIQRLKDYTRYLSELRHHPDGKVRVAWRVAVLALVLLVFLPRTRGIAFTLWIAGNFLLSFGAAGWALFHPRSMRSASAPALRWSVVATLFGTMWLFANFENWLRQNFDRTLAMPSAVLTLTIFIYIPFLCLLAYFIGAWDAAPVAFWLRRRPVAQADHAVSVSVTVSWLFSAALLTLTILSGDTTAGLEPSDARGLAGALRDLLNALLWGGALPTLWLTLGWQRLMARPHPLPSRLLRAASERLVITFSRRGVRRVRDLRGAALGLLAALFALALNQTGLLAPLQALALNSLLNLQGALREEWSGQESEPKKTVTRARGPVQFKTSPDARNPLPAPASYDNCLVLLTIDDQTRRMALSTHSECAVQAGMIRLLKSYGALQIVLPVPALNEANVAPERKTLTPQPAYDDVARSEKDLPELLRAIQEAGNVTAARRNVSDFGTPYAEKRIAAAAQAATPVLLPTYSTPRLPLLPASWKTEAPAPLRYFMLLRGQTPAPSAPRSVSRVLEVERERFPLALDDALLPDFQSPATGRHIPHLTYSEILHRDPLPIRLAASGQNAASGWMSPAQFFKYKIVFLDSLTQDEQETSIGKMTGMEAQARATHALLTNSLVSRPAAGWATFALLALGAVVGQLGFRRNPLEAGWRMALPLLALMTVYIGGICVFRCWLDPVAPAIAALFAFLLVTQATYSVEHDEGGRARALLERFVAPQLLEELLADPRSLGLGGKMQQVCVLFADVRNFTGFTENRDPQEVIGVINEYMTALTDAMYRHGGIFDKYTGDGLMAFFRITDVSPESPQIQQSVSAALAMQEAALGISAQRILAGLTPLAIGIGLHYGEAVVGMVGSPSLANYTALGHTVVVSARLQSIAAGGEIVLSESVFERTVGLRAVAGELVQVKGITAPVRPYRLRAGIPVVPPLPLPHAALPQE